MNPRNFIPYASSISYVHYRDVVYADIHYAALRFPFLRNISTSVLSPALNLPAFSYTCIFTSPVLQHLYASESLQYHIHPTAYKILNRPPTMCQYTILRFPCGHEIYSSWIDCNTHEAGIWNPKTRYKPPTNLLIWCSSSQTQLVDFGDMTGRCMRCPKCQKCACGNSWCNEP